MKTKEVPKDVQVLIVGGGPAGSAASRLLGRNGIETLLIERDLSFNKPCGGGIPIASFEEFSLPRHVIRRLVERIRIVSPLGHILDIPLVDGSIAIVDRREFDSTLRDEAKSLGVRVIQGEFRRFIETTKRIVSEVMVNGEVVQIRSDYVIAADGVNSRVRRSLNLKPQPTFLTVSEKIDGRADSCEFWLGAAHAPGLYSWVFPSDNGLSVGTGAIGSINVKEAFRRFLIRRQLTGNDKVRGYRIPIWRGDTFNKGNILFVGDAAGQVMPLSFEGIYYAMRSGQLAAEAIINSRSSDYKRLWKRSLYKRFLLMRLLWEYFLKSDERAEKLVELLKRPDLQEASMRLWLRKDLSKASLLYYLKHFKEYVRLP